MGVADSLKLQHNTSQQEPPVKRIHTTRDPGHSTSERCVASILIDYIVHAKGRANFKI